MRRNGTHDAEVVVLGGGPAGTATALALRQRGRSVIVVERSDYGDFRIGETVPPSIRPLLGRLGIWEQFLSARHSLSFANRSVWGRSKAYDNDFLFHPYGAGWHVDRNRFDAMLAHGAEDAGARVYRGASLIGWANGGDEGWQIEVAYDHERYRLRTRFLIDATGRASLVARRMDVRRNRYDCLVGVAAFFLPRSSNAVVEQVTLVEAVEDGWWYSAVLPDTRLVVTYLTDADLYARANKRSTNYWLNELQKAPQTNRRAAAYDQRPDLRVFAANSSRLENPGGRNWLAVGDAAMAFDPLASQGICKALGSGIRAAEAFHEYSAGNTTALLDYKAEIMQSFDDYLRMRKIQYGRERRWPNSVFWQRRDPDFDALRRHMHAGGPHDDQWVADAT